MGRDITFVNEHVKLDWEGFQCLAGMIRMGNFVFL